MALAVAPAPDVEGADRRTPIFAVSVAAAALAGLLFGFDTAVIAGVTIDLRRVFGLDSAELGLAVSAALWGTLLGALAAGPLGDRWGSRVLLGATGLLYAASALGSALCWSLETFVLARALGGVAIGATSVLSPVYIAEIAPAARRGWLVGLFQLCIVIGVLTAYLSNFVVALAVADAVEWRWKLGVALLPALMLMFLISAAPQSPRWLAGKGRAADARLAAARLGMTEPPLAKAAAAPAAGLAWGRHARPLLLAIALAMFNQLTGINAILYYLNDIFAAAGFGKVSADLQAVAIGIANLLATLVGMAFIDRAGRRALLIRGAAGMFVALLIVGLVQDRRLDAALLLPALILFVLSFGASQGAVIWVYLAEIFPQPVRAQGAALGAAVHWAMNAAIAAAFPLIARDAAGLPFFLFAAAMLAQIAAVRAFFPETRGLSLDDPKEA